MLLLGKQIEASTTGGPNDSCVTVTLEVGRILGGGCNGLVRLATDVQTGRQYALKVLVKVQMVAAAEHVFQEQQVWLPHRGEGVPLEPLAAFACENSRNRFQCRVPTGEPLLSADRKVSWWASVWFIWAVVWVRVRAKVRV